jgi:hypothetical protein
MAGHERCFAAYLPRAPTHSRSLQHASLGTYPTRSCTSRARLAARGGWALLSVLHSGSITRIDPQTTFPMKARACALAVDDDDGLLTYPRCRPRRIVELAPAPAPRCIPAHRSRRRRHSCVVFTPSPSLRTTDTALAVFGGVET